MNTRKIVLLIFAIVLGLSMVFVATEGYFEQTANEIVVVQAPLSGELTVYFSPGVHSCWGGRVTRYPRRGQIDFDGKSIGSDENGVLHIPTLKVRFNDGAEADVSGSLAWEMPTAEPQVKELYKTYGSASAIEAQIIAKNINKAAFMTGPLMSSAESYATKRNDLLSLVYDQVEHGAYRTESKDVKARDALTGEEKTVRQVNVVIDTNGLPAREDKSLIAESGLHTFNLVLDGIVYGDTVEKQIQSQQQSIMAVQTAIAKAKTAEQDTLTIEQQGKAKAAQAKWDQEAVKAQQVTEAEQKVEVASLNALAVLTNAVIDAQKQLMVAELGAKAAEQTKQAAILTGEGQAQAAQLVMAANGALEQKLKAWTEVNTRYAEAIANYRGNWVPTTVFGSSSSGSVAGGGANDLIQLLTAKTARDINLDLSTAVPLVRVPAVK